MDLAKSQVSVEPGAEASGLFCSLINFHGLRVLGCHPCPVLCSARETGT